MLFASPPSSSLQNPSFKLLSEHIAYAGTRRMLEETFADFDDTDGNFVEQFQTTGFDARFFELYLQAVLTEQGFSVVRPQPCPDFVATRDGLTIAIEATTTNASTSGALAKHGRRLAELGIDGMENYVREEFPIRLGSALTSKLAKRYWTSPQCSGRPLILAIEAFHDQGSLGLSDFSVERYLYGLDYGNPQFRNGILHADVETVSSFSVGPKTIPGPFFDLPDAVHVSAVLFTNQGTSAKFTRMAHAAGYKNGYYNIRICQCLDPDPSSIDPSMFVYDLDAPLFSELWTHGVIIYHNPHALVPLADDVFTGAVDIRLDQGRVWRKFQEHHIYSSNTVYLPQRGRRLPVGPPRGVGTSPQAAEQISFRPPKPFMIDQWFATTTGAVGMLLQHGEQWTSGVVHRQGQAYGLDAPPDVSTNRTEARLLLQRQLLTVSPGTDTVSAFCTNHLTAPGFDGTGTSPREGAHK